MVDRLTPEQRSWNMSRIRSKNTRPEIMVRSILHRLGFRFSLKYKGLPCKPDIVLPKHWTVIFVHGCFWHQHPGCIEASRPSSNSNYWKPKLNANLARDKRNQRILRQSGWNVLKIWECDIESDPMSIARRLVCVLSGQDASLKEDCIPERSKLIELAKKRAAKELEQSLNGKM